MPIDVEAFDEWKAHPITEALLKHCRARAEEQRTRWQTVSWDGGEADPLTLARLRERAIVYQELAEIARDELEEQRHGRT